MCFAEPEWKFLNDRHHKVSNFFGLLKIHKYMIIEFAASTPNSEIINIFEQSDLTLRPIVGSLKCPTRKISHLIGILLKTFLKHMKSFIGIVRIFN